MIVRSSEPVTLIGGAEIGQNDLNIAMEVAPRVIAADSGADQLLAFGEAPEAIFGDFDSISDQARGKFFDRLHYCADQDTTDFEKALDAIEAPLVVALGFIGQRLDHSFAALRSAAVRHKQKILFLSSDDVIIVLRDGSLELTLPIESPFAILPLIGSVVTTQGLKWDLAAEKMSMVGMVSSSNQTTKATIHVAVAGAVAITLPRAELHAAINGVRAI